MGEAYSTIQCIIIAPSCGFSDPRHVEIRSLPCHHDEHLCTRRMILLQRLFQNNLLRYPRSLFRDLDFPRAISGEWDGPILNKATILLALVVLAPIVLALVVLAHVVLALVVLALVVLTEAHNFVELKVIGAADFYRISNFEALNADNGNCRAALRDWRLK